MTGPGDVPARPRELYPAFWGSFDWHSCVEMHWLMVRLMRVAGDVVPAAEMRAALDAHLTAEALAAEAAGFDGPGGRTRSRPYGWGWALTLAEELAAWDDPDARRWSDNMRPLADVIGRRFVEWLPLATYPVRWGAHPNSAFGLSRSLAWAERRAEAGAPQLLEALTGAARRWFEADTDYPGGWEPSGADFLSPALCEAELMTRVLPAGEFPAWLDGFLPGLAGREPGALFSPAVVSDASDGQIAHLHGLNASRAWCWLRLGEILPEDDPRRAVAFEAASVHAAAALPHATGGDYMVEHWLACYAVLLLS
jgi:hypothetical protein